MRAKQFCDLQQHNLGRIFGASKMHLSPSVLRSVLRRWFCCCYLLFNVLPILCGSSVLSLFCYALLCVHSSFAIILKRKRTLVALLLLSYRCIVTLNVLWLLLKVSWVGLQCVIVVFPDHTHLLFV